MVTSLAVAQLGSVSPVSFQLWQRVPSAAVSLALTLSTRDRGLIRLAGQWTTRSLSLARSLLCLQLPALRNERLDHLVVARLFHVRLELDHVVVGLADLDALDNFVG